MVTEQQQEIVAALLVIAHKTNECSISQILDKYKYVLSELNESDKLPDIHKKQTVAKVGVISIN